MTEQTLPDYKEITSTLSANSLAVTPAELHGLLSGMLCGGLKPDSGEWIPMLYDYTNDGMGWPDLSKQVAVRCFDNALSDLSGDDLSFSLLLPEESASLLDRGDAVCEWVSAFIAGVGLMGLKAASLSEEVKEALGDLAEIAQLGIDEDGDMEEQENLLEQVIEHVRICTLTVYADMGQKPEKEEKKTLH